MNINLTNLRKDLFEIANTCLQYNDVINISTKKGNIVMLSDFEYRSLLETLALANIPGFYLSIEKGVKTPIKDCKKINWKK